MFKFSAYDVGYGAVICDFSSIDFGGFIEEVLRFFFEGDGIGVMEGVEFGVFF